MTREQVDTFEKLKAQLDGIHAEVSTFSRKSPNDSINVFKINFVNEVLQRCNQFFTSSYRPFLNFEGFDNNDLPSNSDVTFIISQYIQNAEKFRSDHIAQIGHKIWGWATEDLDLTKGEDRNRAIRTSPPRKLSDR